MAWTTTEDLEDFLAVAGDFLRTRPVEHTMPLTVVAGLSERGLGAFGSESPRFGWWATDDGSLVCTFVHTPPWPVILTSAPAPVAECLGAALAGGPRMAGVNAEEEAALAFARGTGAVWSLHRRQRLFRLGALTPPDPTPPGVARVATDHDRELLLAWNEAFARELGEAPTEVESQVDDRVSYGGLTLWEVDGQPVAMAGTSRQAAGMVRVGPVYTPPEQRRRGYGGAVTVAASRSAGAAGAAEVVLFTDLANPTSNALYQRLGYQPVGDTVLLSFES